MSRPAPTRWVPEFVATAAIWGTSFLFIKVGLERLAPLQVAAGRMVVGAVVLTAITVVSGQRLPRDPRLWRQLATVALIYNSVPFALFAWGETRVSSVLAGIWNATTPLWTLAVAASGVFGDRVGRRQAVGLAVGFAGVVVVLGPWSGSASGLGSGGWLGSAACIGGALCYGIGFPLTRRVLHDRTEPLAGLMAAQMICGAVPLVALSVILDPRPTSLPPRVWLSVVGLGALGTGVAYILNSTVIRVAGPTVASTVTYLVPVVSTTLGVVVLGEAVGWNQPAGAVVVLAGVAVSRRPPREHADAQPRLRD